MNEEHNRMKLNELSKKLDDLYDAVVGNTQEETIGMRAMLREVLVIVKGTPEQPGLIRRVSELERAREEDERRKAAERGWIKGASAVSAAVGAGCVYVINFVIEWAKGGHKP